MGREQLAKWEEQVRLALALAALKGVRVLMLPLRLPLRQVPAPLAQRYGTWINGLILKVLRLIREPTPTFEVARKRMDLAHADRGLTLRWVHPEALPPGVHLLETPVQEGTILHGSRGPREPFACFRPRPDASASTAPHPAAPGPTLESHP